jgi:hypothetical protein
MDTDFLSADDASTLEDMTLTINAFFGWDFNSCEALSQEGTWYPIDFANACPDSQVTSLHYHFPWLVIANLKWSLFVAATRRPMRRTLDWDAFYEIAREDEPYRKKLKAYAKMRARDSTTTASRSSVRRNWRTSPRSRGVLRHRDGEGSGAPEDAALYPAHEVERFTELFWERIQTWRNEPLAAAPVRMPARRKKVAS